MSSTISYYDELLQFWFSDEIARLWFNSTPEFDDELRKKYESVYQAAVRGLHDDWRETPAGCLALIILFDQIPLNIYRGKKQSFATEARARDVAKYAIARSFDKKLEGKQKAFLYMPFMHSEDMDDQNYSVELFESANLKENLRFAQHHRGIIERFGRFPHRNSILDRKSTEAEQEYLQSKEAFLG